MWPNHHPDENDGGKKSSLDLLLPQSMSSNIKSADSKSPTANLLENLSIQLASRIAKHEWNHPDIDEYIAPNYAAYLDYTEKPYVRGRQNFIENYRKFTSANPNYTIEAETVVADVNEQNGTAAVWILFSVTGHPPNVRRESVTILHWKRTAGNWMLCRQTGIRGAGGYI